MFEVNKKEIIKKFLISIGTGNVPHVKRGSLYDHLVRVADILDGWSMGSVTTYAGMCHSLYSTEFFKTAILTIDKRNDLRELIGKDAEELVYLFCSMKRSTLSCDGDEYFFEDLYSGGKVTLTKEKFVSLVHILIANDIDHLTLFNVSSRSSHFGEYQIWTPFLCDKAKDYLSLLSVDQVIGSTESDSVRFIAHAGVHIKSGDVAIAVDPWLYSSTRENPIIQGFDPDSFTIDYLIPEPRNKIKDIESDIILLSHFHTHHAPYKEIKELVSFRSVDIVCPNLSKEKILKLKESIGEKLFGRITFHFLEKDTILNIRGITISCLTHSHKEHFAYFIKTEKTSVLHIADIAANSSHTSLLFDSFWSKFDNLSPEFLFISSAGHNLRHITERGERVILENATLTPTQAAKATCKIKPKNVGIVGVYNFSAWSNRAESPRSYEQAEAEFYWAMSFLAPAIRVHKLRPGDVFYSEQKR